ncbi:Glycosyltransferase involved in cell wall bisynthesis [Paenibacillus sophorae]|uniref:Glycosyltransferase family 4 protein n=1 Tax=Paenibacillus sophorae TaxID=1333845 RepID=A0A1H8QAA6_9BACL|nr:glycosyltransferase family 4 protein [Paenibacillus sophorae]QWU15203.1 glycosyltransferase family 4 protein [Paenibacillus sophorae]SEO51162.1 Glycosyltransferase involved in cell wall bisynthesis [Paenibacillus sophorae]
MADKAAVVLFSHVSNDNSITGAEKLLLFFARELSSYFDCLLVAPQEGKLTRQARRSGISVELLPIPLVYGMYTPYAGLEEDIKSFQEGREFRELHAWLAQRHPAFIVTSTCVHVLPAIAAKSLGIPVVWKISEIITENDHTPLSINVIDRFSDQIICISQTAAFSFTEEIQASKIALLPPTWDDQEMMTAAWSKLRGERRRELRIKPAHRLVGYISSFIIPQKGLEHFIHMAILVAKQHPEARFLVIGEPRDKDYYNRCKHKMKLEGLSSRFRFAGYEKSLSESYCAMDVLVVPSLVREGFGMTAMEGLAFGKPVVAYDSGGLGEIMRAVDGTDGLVPPENIEALAQRVEALLAQPVLAATIGVRSRGRVIAAYGPAAYRERLRGLAEAWRLRWAGADAAAQAEPPAGETAGADAPPEQAPQRKRRASKRRGRLRRRLARRAASPRRARRAKRPSRASRRRTSRKRRSAAARRR